VAVRLTATYGMWQESLLMEHEELDGTYYSLGNTT